MKYLICEHQLDPLSEDDSYETPLHLACERGHLDILKYLVDEQSVDPDCVSSAGLTPLHMACFTGQLKVMKFLIVEKGCEHTRRFQNDIAIVTNLLHMASAGGHVDVARYLIEKQNYDPMGNTGDRRTPLSLACKGGHLEMVKYLVNEQLIDPVK